MTHPLTNPTLSTRGRQMPASPIRMLMPLADAARARGITVLHLNIGQPDLETPPPMRARLRLHEEPVYAYTPSAGTPDFIRSLRGYYLRLGHDLAEREIIATAGGSEALLFALMACGNEGDEALVVEPFYTNYRAFALMAGIGLKPVMSRGEDGFHLPPDSVWEKALTPRTRMVLLCNPNNPTGTVYDRDELERLAEFCRRHNLFLISDEVYREFVYDGRPVISALDITDMDKRVVVVDSLSKRYSACGMRLGCLVTRNPDLQTAFLHMAQGRLSAPGLAQVAALGALELGPDYFETVRAEYGRRRDLLYHGLSAIPGVFLRKPEGAFYCIARLPVDDSDDFARWLLEDFDLDGFTVMLSPAAGFYATAGLGRDEVRIAYVLQSDDLATAVRILSVALPVYQSLSERRQAG